MKSSNVSIVILVLTALAIGLINSSGIDDLHYQLHTLVNATHATEVDANIQTQRLVDILRLIADSHLRADSLRFMLDYISLHVGNLPDLNHISSLIEVLQELEVRTAEKASKLAKNTFKNPEKMKILKGKLSKTVNSQDFKDLKVMFETGAAVGGVI